jgi:hypothetical protein
MLRVYDTAWEINFVTSHCCSWLIYKYSVSGIFANNDGVLYASKKRFISVTYFVKIRQWQDTQTSISEKLAFNQIFVFWNSESIFFSKLQQQASMLYKAKLASVMCGQIDYNRRLDQLSSILSISAEPLIKLICVHFEVDKNADDVAATLNRYHYERLARVCCRYDSMIYSIYK